MIGEFLALNPKVYSVKYYNNNPKENIEMNNKATKKGIVMPRTAVLPSR